MPFRHRTRARIACSVLLAIVFAGVIPVVLDAAIAPRYERLRQFDFVMSAGSEAAGKLAPHGLIDRIERMDDGTFRFWAGPCFVPVTLQQLPSKRSPPVIGESTDYRVSLGAARCD